MTGEQRAERAGQRQPPGNGHARLLIKDRSTGFSSQVRCGELESSLMKAEDGGRVDSLSGRPRREVGPGIPMEHCSVSASVHG